MSTLLWSVFPLDADWILLNLHSPDSLSYQSIIRQSHPPLRSHLCRVREERCRCCFPTGLRGLIRVGLAWKFRYSGFSSFSLQSPVSGWSLCEMWLFILLDEPRSGPRFAVLTAVWVTMLISLNPGHCKLRSIDRLSATLWDDYKNLPNLNVS